MNKTITINLGGVVFHIEEAAFQSLKQYIDAIEQRFGKGEAGKEILNDIEARMAELLQPRLNEGKQAVLPEDIQFVMGQLGKPEDFGEGQPEAQSSSNPYTTYNIPPDGLKRRLFRNQDDRVIGGVCSGIAAYFGWDPVWMRIAFAASLILGVGSGFLLYLILWIALPVAHTPIEKLQMRGEDVTLRNIEETIKKEAQALGNTFKKKTNDLRVTGFFNDIFHILGQIIKGVLLAFIIFVAFIFFFITIAFLFGNMHFGGHRIHVLEHFNSVIPAGKIWLLKIGFALMGFAPAVVLLIWALKSIFKWHLNTGLVVLTGFILFGAGVVTILSIGKSISEKFEYDATVKLTQYNYLPNKQLLIKMDGPVDEIDYNDNNISFFGSNFHFRTMDNNDTFILNNVDFTVERSDNDSVQITTTSVSNGSSYSEARTLASNIKYAYTLNDSVLILPRNIYMDNPVKWRNQNVTVTIKVPLNTKVHLHKNTHSYINENMPLTDNDFETDKMNGHRFIMQNNGLQCLDCTGSDKVSQDDDDDNRHIKTYHKTHEINGKLHQIKINNKGVEVIMDDKGIRRKIKVDGDSVSIK